MHDRKPTARRIRKTPRPETDDKPKTPEPGATPRPETGDKPEMPEPGATPGPETGDKLEMPEPGATPGPETGDKPQTPEPGATPRPETGGKPETPELVAQPIDNGSTQPNEKETEIVSALNEAVQALAQSLTNIATSLQERQAEQTQKYYAALMAAAPHDDGDQLSSAYQTVLDAVASQDANRIAAAQKSYVKLLSELMSKLTKRSEAATKEHLADYEDLKEEAQKYGQEQYFHYIETLRNVMNKASQDNLTPAALLMIIQNMASAAMLCQGSFPHSE